MHYREICYLSGRVVREELSDWSVNKCNTSIVLYSIRVSNDSDNLFILYKSLMANVCKE
jgi:regulation of enolase protein 1 (concanavalin A-like superfamily)